MAQFLQKNIYCQLCWKDENKEKEAGKETIFKKTIISSSVFDDSRVYNLDSRSELLSYSKVVHYDRR